MTKHVAADEFIVWLESLGGMLTKMKTEYDGIAVIVEHPDWDETSHNACGVTCAGAATLPSLN